ncbi:MAG: NADPH:quinone reductase [Planctomycetota bacterium]
MKAIIVQKFGEPQVMKLQQVDQPRPGPGQVLIEVKAAGVNPVDTYIRAGTYSFGQVPYTPGFDAAGVVEAVGEGVTKVAVGDRVYTFGSVSGTYAEMALCQEQQVHPLPDKISFEAGAALGIPYTTAYRALFQKARAQADEVVLVHGASGGVGIAAVQLAKAAGMTVIGTAGTQRGRDLVAKQGAHHVLDHHKAAYMQKAMALTNSRGFDVVLEMLADVNLGGDLEVMAKNGRVVVIGCRGTVEINPRLAMQRDISIIGMITTNATDQEMAAIQEAIQAGLKDGTLHPVVAQSLPLPQAPKAHQEVIESPHHGKIVLIP